MQYEGEATVAEPAVFEVALPVMKRRAKVALSDYEDKIQESKEAVNNLSTQTAITRRMTQVGAS